MSRRLPLRKPDEHDALWHGQRIHAYLAQPGVTDQIKRRARRRERRHSKREARRYDAEEW